MLLVVRYSSPRESHFGATAVALGAVLGARARLAPVSLGQRLRHSRVVPASVQPPAVNSFAGDGGDV